MADIGLFSRVVAVVAVVVVVAVVAVVVVVVEEEEMYNCLRIFPELRKIPPFPVGSYLALFHLIWKEI